MSAVARDTGSIKQSLGNDFSDGYLVTGMDGETFGHHRPGLESLLFSIIEDFNLVFPEQVVSSESFSVENFRVISSTWASSKQDIDNGVQFLSWKDPSNGIHKFQLDFFNFAYDLFKKVDSESKGFADLRHKMDVAMASDHYWWASAKPWWSLEMIEDGAYRLLDVVKSIPDLGEDFLTEAYVKYYNIVSTAAEWQRSGKVREMALEQNEILRIPFKERTKEAGGLEPAVYQAFIDLMKEEEKKAAEAGNYEKAVLWRDSVYKLENKSDIYDAISSIDLLRLDIGNKKVEETIEKYKEDYKQIRGGQPEQRGS
jgi:hypothetical protein